VDSILQSTVLDILIIFRPFYQLKKKSKLMRTIKNLLLCTFIALGFQIQTQAQEVTFPLESGSWEFMLLAYDSETNSYSTSCYNYAAVGDTTFNAKSYKTIWNEYLAQPGYFRQEGQKVFYVPDPEIYSWNADADEYSVYDFSLELGEVTWLYAFTESAVDSAEATVLAVDSIALDTIQMRKKIGFGNVPQALPYSGCSLTWVEGIGQINYLPFYFWPSEQMCVTNDYQLLFDCLTIEGENVFGSCSCIGFTGVEDVVDVSLTITPNPTTGLLRLENLPESTVDIMVFDKLGATILTTQSPDIDLSDFPAGLYYVAAVNKGFRYTGKVVKY
jgi:hypothetical protein